VSRFPARGTFRIKHVGTTNADDNAKGAIMRASSLGILLSIAMAVACGEKGPVLVDEPEAGVDTRVGATGGSIATSGGTTGAVGSGGSAVTGGSIGGLGGFTGTGGSVGTGGGPGRDAAADQRTDLAAVPDAGIFAIDSRADTKLADAAPADLPPPDAPLVTLQGVFVPTGSMTMARQFYAAALLGNGKVLFVGGRLGTEKLASAELYDPATGKFTATGNMITAREIPSATLLPNGKVLVAGGAKAGSGALALAELYDPVTETFAATGSLAVARYSHTATLLPNGKVLIAGGEEYIDGHNYFESAELYDASPGTFTATGSMTMYRSEHTATLLQNGKVLMVGGAGDTLNAELYNPLTGTFTTTGTPTVAGLQHRATLLGNGTVLIAGGLNMRSAMSPNEKRTELYDPNTGTFTETGSMTSMRAGPAATLLTDGKVLVAGGRSDTSADLYDPSTGTFSATGSMTMARARPIAILLGNGRVLITDFYGESGSAELYQ
jgi:hypothetical protein